MEQLIGDTQLESQDQTPRRFEPHREQARKDTIKKGHKQEWTHAHTGYKGKSWRQETEERHTHTADPRNEEGRTRSKDGKGERSEKGRERGRGGGRKWTTIILNLIFFFLQCKTSFSR